MIDNKGIFTKKAPILKEIIMAIAIMIGLLITFINPLAWITYFIFFKLGVYSIGDERTEMKLAAQFFSFIVSILSYIGLVIYIGLS